jgi:adenylate cyclase
LDAFAHFVDVTAAAERRLTYSQSLKANRASASLCISIHIWQFWLAAALATRCAGRYEESASWAAKILQEEPDFVPALISYAVSSALANRLEGAQRAVSHALRIEPRIRLSNIPVLSVLRRPEDRSKFCEGARLADIPE